jgi:hypothetical protein
MRNKHSYIFLYWHVNRMFIAYINELSDMLATVLISISDRRSK